MDLNQLIEQREVWVEVLTARSKLLHQTGCHYLAGELDAKIQFYTKEASDIKQLNSVMTNITK